MKNLTKLLLLIFLTSYCQLLLPTLSNAQSPNYLWVKSAGGTGNDYGGSVSTDANGNIIVTGSFASSSITFGTTTLTNAGGADIFIVKYNGAGNVLWAKSTGGTSDDSGGSVSTDANGNIIVTGSFGSSSITFGTTTLTNAGGADIFIVKYDGAGNVMYAKSEGGTGNDYGRSVSTDANGNIIVTGEFWSSSITFGTTTLTNAGYDDIFIVKYDGAGNVLWAKSAVGNFYDNGLSVSTDANGNIIVTGEFMSASITFGTTTLTNASTNRTDIFIVKYDGAGNVLWAKSAGGTGYDRGHSVSTDANGNIIVTGDFLSSSITFGTTTLTNAGNTDIFIVKYDGAGNVLWAKSAGGPAGDYGVSVSTDANGNIIVTGEFWSSSITFGTTTLTNPGYADIFIVKYDGAGNVMWAKSAGGTNQNQEGGNSVSTDANGNIIVTGRFGSSSITFGTTTLTNAGASDTYDIFIVKLDGVTGIAENFMDNNRVSIYPNPFSSTATIRIDDGRFTTCDFKMYDVMGREVFRQPIVNRKSEIVNPNLPSGIYFYQLQSETEILKTGKIIVE